MSTLRSATRIARFAVTAHDAIGRAPAIVSHDLELLVSGRFPADPAVIVTNHVSYLDPICVAAVLPVAPIAKREVASWPLLGTAAARLGTLDHADLTCHLGAHLLFEGLALRAVCA